jgi:single-strand DNA-binding protein
MGIYLNSVTLIGNLTRDPELKALPSGTKVANFSIATNRNWKDKDGAKKEEVEYHNLVAFGRTAEVIEQYTHKGDQIYIDGRLQTRSWEKDGEKKYRTEIIVESFQFGSKKPGTAPKTNESNKNEEKVDTTTGETPSVDSDPIAFPEQEINPNDIPF